MPVILDLVNLYRAHGYEILAGMQPRFTNGQILEFTYLYKDKTVATTHLGISSLEIYFLESLFSAFRPKTLFGVGNSFGWSSFALALLNPSAPVRILELGGEAFTHEWIGRTNAIAAERGLDLSVTQGRSPEDVTQLVCEHLQGRVDFAFLDGVHSADAVQADIAAVRPHLGPDGLLLMHDAVSYDLLPAIAESCRSLSLRGQIFYGTSSGLVLAFERRPAWMDDLAAAFGASVLGSMTEIG